MFVLVDKLNSVAQRLGLNTGIDPKRKNYPDQMWILIALSTLEPNDEVFHRTYVPPVVKRSGVPVVEAVMPEDGFFDGLEHVFAGKKRSKKGTLAQLMSKDAQLEMKITNKSARIDAQVEALNK